MKKIKTNRYKKTGVSSFFWLSKLNNPLEKLSSVVDFELFRTLLESKLLNNNKKSNAGCKPYDVVIMFKIIILKQLYALSDEQAEYRINDRQSFKDFLGFCGGDTIPDHNTIWNFQESLVKNNLDKELFGIFYFHLKTNGFILNSGKIVDASFVEVPRQRNTKEENYEIKKGNGSALWSDNPDKKSRKDTDARWCIKNGEKHFGYSNNIKVKAGSKFIDTYTIPNAKFMIIIPYML